MLAHTFALLFVASSVLAHGYVRDVHVDNPEATFSGYMINTDPYMPTPPDRVVRKIPGDGPVEDVTSIDIQCNKGSSPAALVAPIAAGSAVSFNWTTAWPTSHFGPVITYMAKAPIDIRKWMPGKDRVWFKIDEAGLKDGKWAATDVLLGNKGLWTVKVPPSLKSGKYLIRHELIALHGAGTYPGAQFYPMCTQVEVTGSGTALPADSDLVSFPGAYKPEDPGVTYQPYIGLKTYPIPGPAVWNGTGTGTGSGGSTAGSGSGASSGTGTISGSGSSSGAGGNSRPGPGGNSGTGIGTGGSGSSAGSGGGTNSQKFSTGAQKSKLDKNPCEELLKPDGSQGSSAQSAPMKDELAAHYAQCGGRGFDGPTACVTPYICKQSNEYYSQCVQPPTR